MWPKQSHPGALLNAWLLRSKTSLKFRYLGMANVQTSHALIVIIVFTPWSIQQSCYLGWFVCCWCFQTLPAIIASSNCFSLRMRHYGWEHWVAFNFSAWFQFLMPTLRAEMYQKWQIFPPLSCQSWKTQSMLRYNQQPWAVMSLTENVCSHILTYMVNLVKKEAVVSTLSSLSRSCAAFLAPLHLIGCW